MTKARSLTWIRKKITNAGLARWRKWLPEPFSKPEPDAAVDDSAFERSLRIDGADAEGARRWPDERVVVRLADVRKIFDVGKETRLPNTPLGDGAPHQVRHALVPIRRLVDLLTTGVEELHA